MSPDRRDTKKMSRKAIDRALAAERAAARDTIPAPPPAAIASRKTRGADDRARA